MSEIDNSQDNKVDLDGGQSTDNAVAQDGAYEVIRKRLTEQSKSLVSQTQSLNEQRLNEFGSSNMATIGRVRVRTENNCIARDIVQVGDILLFGYNVYIGLKREITIQDVFSTFTLANADEGFELSPVPFENSFLNDSSFTNDFDELYRYYKDTKLIQLVVKNNKLLAAFQIGERLSDLRVFRWGLSPDGKTVSYIDNRGERDIQPPPAYDFEWIQTGRDDFVHGRHPHINILNTVFVETINGDLTVKIENNTDDGLGIYREPVDEENQSLDDMELAYAQVGSLILLRVRPYQEDDNRYLVYNSLNESVVRIDQIGLSCVQLPEDHGVIFPGGYYLDTGDYKTYDDHGHDLKFKRAIKSPNGEDVLYVFYEPKDGVVALFGYNLIEKKIHNPIFGHGYALADDGKLVIFSAEGEPTRVHPMQIWETPYISDELASQAPASQSFYGKIGNAELVRGISDLYSISRLADSATVSKKLYEELSVLSKKTFDLHYWLDDSHVEDIAKSLKNISATSELVIDEYEKVESIRKQSAKAMTEAEVKQDEIIRSISYENWELAEEYVEALSKIRHQKGHLLTIKTYRYIDIKKIESLEKTLLEFETTLSDQTVKFLSDEKALLPYLDKVSQINVEIESANTSIELQPIIENIESTAFGLDLLSELMSTLQVDDANLRTRIIDAISDAYSRLNQSKAKANIKKKDIGSDEFSAQFAAQFKLFSQSVTNALSLSETPEKCDEQLSRLLVQLEELESQFSEYENFLSDIMHKREEVYEHFDAHKQQLLDQQQRKAQTLNDAAVRILNNIQKRVERFSTADEMNAYFASDSLVMKVFSLSDQLKELDDPVKADDIDARFKSIKEQALRALRDKTEIFEDGGNIIKLGPRHKFSVNTQELDVTIIPKDHELCIHLSGTNYFEPIKESEISTLTDYWDMSLSSESLLVYRAEYLAFKMIQAAEKQSDNLSDKKLLSATADFDQLTDLVKEYSSPLYKEGYVKGIHDHDAALILSAVVPVLNQADLLKYSPTSRGAAQVFWDFILHSKLSESYQFSKDSWLNRSQAAIKMRDSLASLEAYDTLVDEMLVSITRFVQDHPIAIQEQTLKTSARYLVEELGRANSKALFAESIYARQLVDAFHKHLKADALSFFNTALNKVTHLPEKSWELTASWLDAFIAQQQLPELSHYRDEAIAIINCADNLERRAVDTEVEITVSGLLGEHSKLKDQSLHLTIDNFLSNLHYHNDRIIPEYEKYLSLRHKIIEDEKDILRLGELKARPLSSFVRNQLINDVFLPVIGDNFAKQMGTVGENKRTDLMGLLMMISPPGYGKTTLMEYVASRLGLIFVKINCPSLGHEVTSLDPAQTKNSTGKSELEKINLAFEMGNNVMLYLDDIQHTHPEFLQKFISLCDGTRRIEGVWKGQTKTYDMRGKKFCVVMSGNPYTESGEVFKVPDMLANRADIYNLGDVIGDSEEQFAMSYIENSLTSNPVLAPLAVREMSDVYKLIDKTNGLTVASTDLSHEYSAAEINEITSVLQKMFVIRDVVFKVNQQYIISAAQNDKYRTEPPFKLQGSYRNMNKMAEKVSAVMNDEELMQLIHDHYIGEAQLLTHAAEANLLKLAELRGNITAEQEARWNDIKMKYKSGSKSGGSSMLGEKLLLVLSQASDSLNKVASLLGDKK